MNSIQAQIEVGEDRVLRVQLPEDAPTGLLDVVVRFEPHRPTPTLEQRRRAAREGRGALKGLGVPSVDEFLAERREDDRRREQALGS